MSRPINQDNVWDFEVTREQVATNSGIIIPNTHALVRKDRNAVVGIVSETSYGILQNVDYISTVRSALQTLGLTGYDESILTTRDGSRLFATYTWKDKNYKLAKVGDTVGMRMQFTNSYDLSLAASVRSGGLVLRCTNGMVGLSKDMALTKQRHSTDITPEFAAKVIQEVAANFEKSLGVLEQFAEIKVTPEQGANILRNMGLPDRTTDKLLALWGVPNFSIKSRRSLYGVLDTVTEFARDIVSIEQSNRINETAIKYLRQGLMPEGFKNITAIPVES